MIVKQLFLDDSGQKKLKSGIKKISGAVKSTLGPGGHTVLLESENEIGGFRVTKDGVTVARSIALYDPVENLAVQMMQEGSIETAKTAGDGTTTAIVLTEAILDGSDLVFDKSISMTKLISQINNITDYVVDEISKKSIKVTGKRLVDVATVSANNDPVLGKLIAGAYKKVNHVTVADSPTNDTYSEIIEGIKIDRGYSSKHQITNEEKEEAVLSMPYILVSDIEIKNLHHLEGIFRHAMQNARPLFIIANMTSEAMQAFNLNVGKKVIKACHIMPPSFGIRKTDMLRDIATAVGAVFYSEDTGDNMEAITPEGLGEANKIIASVDKTVVICNKDTEAEAATDDLIVKLKKQLAETTNYRERDFLKERIANISGGVGVIYVGANSPIEQKEKLDRVDDAVKAVASAIEEGVIAGGGIQLYNIARKLIVKYVTDDSADDAMALKIMAYALLAPLSQIIVNAGEDVKEVISFLEETDTDSSIGLNIKTGEYGDMLKMGIIDPAKVTKTALKNAVSVATTILSTEVIITNMRDNAVQATE